MTITDTPENGNRPTGLTEPREPPTLVAPGTVVALHGPSGVGKDWVATEILAKQGYQPWAIAYPMKAMLVADLVRDHSMELQEALRAVFVERAPETRERLLGGRTAALRASHGEDVFARIALAYLAHRQRTTSPMRGVVITDARSHQETRLLMQAGASVIHLKSEGLAQRHDIGTASRHTIEVQGASPPPDADVVWNNHSDPQATRDAIAAILPTRAPWPAMTDELPLPPLALHAWMLDTGCHAHTPEAIAIAVGKLCRDHPGERARAAMLAADMSAREGDQWTTALADSWGWIRRNLWRTTHQKRGGR